MISCLDEYISVSGLEGLQEVQRRYRRVLCESVLGAPYKTPYTIPQSTVAFNFTKRYMKRYRNGRSVTEYGRQ